MRVTWSRGRTGFAGGALALALALGAGAAQPVVNDKARALKEFTDRAQAYAELHKKLAADVPKLPDKATPEQISAHEEALTTRLKAARASARQGDVFTPDAAKVLLELLRAEFREPDGARLRETVRQDNPKPDLKDPKIRTRPQGTPPTAEVVLAPNTPYPEAAPVSTVPAEILGKLPPLPEPLEYRFVGRHLVLRDRAADMIVDFITGAMPLRSSTP
jgi:hypothetical protein